MRVATHPQRPLRPTGESTHDLYERLLEVERAYTAFNSRRALRPDEGQLQWRPLEGHALAVRDPVRPEIAYYNRVLGMNAASLGELDELVAWHDEIGAPTQLDLGPDAAHNAAVLETLQERGFRHAGVVTVLVGRPEALVAAAPARSPGISIAPVSAANIEVFFDHLESTAPSLPPIRPELRALRRAHFVSPAFRVYLAAQDDAAQPVASAALFVHEGVAVLANATTLPRARGLGLQRALLRHRLCEAASLGCDLVVTDVLWGATSPRDVERVGLRPVWDVAWWLRDETC